MICREPVFSTIISEVERHEIFELIANSSTAVRGFIDEENYYMNESARMLEDEVDVEEVIEDVLVGTESTRCDLTSCIASLTAKMKKEKSTL
jgi:hypothetical protein